MRQCIRQCTRQCTRQCMRQCIRQCTTLRIDARMVSLTMMPFLHKCEMGTILTNDSSTADEKASDGAFRRSGESPGTRPPTMSKRSMVRPLRCSLRRALSMECSKHIQAARVAEQRNSGVPASHQSATQSASSPIATSEQCYLQGSCQQPTVVESATSLLVSRTSASKLNSKQLVSRQ